MIKHNTFDLLRGRGTFLLTLTKPWLIKYSNMYTAKRGITNLSSDGMYRILSVSDRCVSPPVALSWSFGAWLNRGSESLFGIVLGLRSNTQNVAPSSSGTLNIISIVFTGVMPISVRAAYRKEPKMPAPPVPLDHVLMTFLWLSNYNMNVMTTDQYALLCVQSLPMEFRWVAQKWGFTKTWAKWRQTDSTKSHPFFFCKRIKLLTIISNH